MHFLNIYLIVITTRRLVQLTVGVGDRDKDNVCARTEGAGDGGGAQIDLAHCLYVFRPLIIISQVEEEGNVRSDSSSVGITSH